MNKHDVGMNIKQARKNKKLTQKELAELIGFSESSISKYEQGLIKIPNTVLERIAKLLEVPLSDICGWDIEYNSDDVLKESVDLQERIQKEFGSDALELLNDFDTLILEAKNKACDYVSDLTLIDKYCKNKKEPSSAATDNGSDNENTNL